MASIRRRGQSWQARVTRKGVKTSVKTFQTKTEALQWARLEEHQLDAPCFDDDFCMSSAVKPAHGQTLISELPVKALVGPVLPWLAWFD